MKGRGFSGAGLTALFFATLLVGCATDGEPSKEGTTVSEEGAEGVEVALEALENPCDCFEKGLSRGQLRFCRESKRDVNFLEALRKCGDGEVDGVSAIDKLPGDGQYTMDPKVTVVQWKGQKLGMTETGTISVRSCILSIQNSQLVSGNVVVEMNAIKPTSQEGLAARNLAEHLRSEDFFDVANHPTASFALESGKADGRGGLILDGKLNIKGITQPVSGTLSFSSSDPVVATVGMTFNRADFDVRYGSGTFFDNLGDDMISDEVVLQMALVEDMSLRKGN